MPALKNIFQFTAAPSQDSSEAIKNENKITANPLKLLRIKTLGLDFHQGLLSLTSFSHNRINFEEAPYDFDRIIEAIDTDSYVKQAFLKYKELFFKEGWEIISENQDAVNYLYQRIDLMEEIMQRPFNDYLMEVVDNLIKFANVFIVEGRGDIARFFPGKLYPEEGKLPISGYYTIPTETVKIKRDRHNNPIAYIQSIQDTSYGNTNLTEPRFSADEVIHLYLDKKPGRAFGTPFIVSAIDDVVALRQLEEDAQNLVHKELFPLYKYIVGTEENPAQPGDVEAAAEQLANLRVEGGLIIPNDHDVDVIGGQGKALDAAPYLDLMRERVVAGLGLSLHHLGIMNQGGNRSVTDRLDIALYDKVKVIQSYVEDVIRLKIFNPLLREGGFDITAIPQSNGISNKCFLRFKEIDIDTQIKKENHISNLFTSNMIDLEEARLKLGQDPEYNIEHMYMTMTANLQTIQQIAVQQNAAAVAPTVVKTATGQKTTPAKGLPPVKKADAQDPSTGILPNAKNAKKATSNRDAPANQFTKKLSPNVRHFDDDIDILEYVVNTLEEKEM